MVELLVNEKLIPIFGSGFTAGSKTKQGEVLNSKIASEIMKKNIKKYLGETLDDNDFFGIADVFIEGMSSDIKDDFFLNYFTRVKLNTIERKLQEQVAHFS